MNLYEKVMILDPSLDERAVEETVEKVKGVIIKKGGEILKTENWGIKKLAYELNKRQKGHYILLLFKSPPSVISEFERLSKVTDTIIKFMVVKLKKRKHIEAVMSSLTVAEEKTDDSKPGHEPLSESNQSETPTGEDKVLSKIRSEQEGKESV